MLSSSLYMTRSKEFKICSRADSPILSLSGSFYAGVRVGLQVPEDGRWLWECVNTDGGADIVKQLRNTDLLSREYRHPWTEVDAAYHCMLMLHTADFCAQPACCVAHSLDRNETVCFKTCSTIVK